MAERRAGKQVSMTPQDPAAVRQHLDLLRIEHDLAVAIGLDSDPAYMADLKHQLATYEAAWVGAAVTEIAVSRAEQQGRPQG
ncbi:MAG TPA: hypothetical protein VD790_00095 [Thermoleophilaceae bacterium]|nr:hypothetical protein [Thermoleophilaceae bacterium]